MEQGALTEATRTFEHVMAIDRRNKSARERFINFLQVHGQKSRAVREMLILADAYSGSENPAAAARTLSQAAALEPKDAKILEKLAEAQEASGDNEACARTLARLFDFAEVTPDRKATLLSRMVSVAPENIEARDEYIKLLLAQNQNEKAASILRESAEVYARKGEWQQAHDCYDQAAKLQPETVDLLRHLLQEHRSKRNLMYINYARLGDKLAEQGQIDAALSAYGDARAISDSSASLIQKYIDVYVQIAPENAAIPDYLLLAQKHTIAGDKSAAQSTYQHVLLLDPENFEAQAGVTALAKWRA
jgi:tetratricopeptide (TPR) repeat protein